MVKVGEKVELVEEVYYPCVISHACAPLDTYQNCSETYYPLLMLNRHP